MNSILNIGSSTLKKNLTAYIGDSIDTHLMDTPNITNMIIDYAKYDTLTYWASDKNFIEFSGHGKVIGCIPNGDKELLERIRELVNVCGWTNEDKSIRLDKTSWKNQHDSIRRKIMSL